MDPDGTGKVDYEAFNEYRSEIELPPQFEHIKNNKKIFQAMDHSKDDLISLVEWLNI